MTDPILDRLGSALADRYRLDRPVGVGATATVFLARDRTLAASRYDLALQTPGLQLLVNWFLHRNAELR